MLASSSRVLLRSAPAARSRFSGQSLNMQTSARRSKHAPVVVELLESVEGLGEKLDRVSVSVGRMRHQLAPFRLARWIPWKRAGERVTETLRYPRSGPAQHPAIAAPGLGTPVSATPPLSAAPQESAQETLNLLHSLPSTFTFPLRTLPQSDALHGSLTLSDVQRRVDEHGLGGQAEVGWAGREPGARVKELGTWVAVVALRAGGKEEVRVNVDVVRLE